MPSVLPSDDVFAPSDNRGMELWVCSDAPALAQKHIGHCWSQPGNRTAVLGRVRYRLGAGNSAVAELSHSGPIVPFPLLSRFQEETRAVVLFDLQSVRSEEPPRLWL